MKYLGQEDRLVVAERDLGGLPPNARKSYCPTCTSPVLPGDGVGDGAVYCRRIFCAKPLLVRAVDREGRVTLPRGDDAGRRVALSFPGVHVTDHVSLPVERSAWPALRDLARRINLSLPDDIAAPSRVETEGVERAEQKELHRYQVEGVRYLAPRLRALLADDMGLGKTVQSLCALRKQGRGLVICPGHLRDNWMREIRMWRRDLDARRIDGIVDVEELVPAAYEIVVASYDSLPALPSSIGASIADRFRGVTMIVDEAHKAKNPEAQRTQSVRRLGHMATAVWLLTGTPLLNRPPDLYELLESGGVAKKLYPRFEEFALAMGGVEKTWSIKDARTKQNRLITRWVFEDDPDREVPGKLSWLMLRRLKPDVDLELPPKQRHYIEVEVPPGLMEEYAAEANELEGVDNADELPPFEKFSAARRALAEARIPALLDIVEEYEAMRRPLVVFSMHRAPILALAERDGWLAVFGGADEDGSAAAEQYNTDTSIKGIALTFSVGSEGLNLVRGSHLLFVDRAWNPSENLQAEDRVCRIGQRSNSVDVAIMTSNHPLDRHVERLLEWKTKLAELAIGDKA